MIDADKLKQCLYPETSQHLVNWILFTNKHHNSHRTPEETIAVFKKHSIGEYIDFNKLEELMSPKPVVSEQAFKDSLPKGFRIAAVKEDTPVSYIETIMQARQVNLVLNHQQAGELFNLLDANKEQHLELHELLYQAMTKELFSRGGLQ